MSSHPLQEVTALSGPWRDLTPFQASCFTCAVPVYGLGAWHFLLIQMSTRRLFPSTLAQLLPSWSGFPPLSFADTQQTSLESCAQWFPKHSSEGVLMAPRCL